MPVCLCKSFKIIINIFLHFRLMMLLKASKSDPPVGAIIVGQVTKSSLQVKWEAETSLDIGDGVLLNTGASIIRLVTSTV